MAKVMKQRYLDRAIALPQFSILKMLDRITLQAKLANVPTPHVTVRVLHVVYSRPNT
jgi:hypothetical protein